MKYLWLVMVGFFWANFSMAETKEVPDDLFRNVANELRCPTCKGLSVLDSDAKFSVQIKDEVKLQLSQGKSKIEILAFFSERYGPWILRVPPKEGVSALAWWFPIGLLVIGPILVWFFVWRKHEVVVTAGVRSTEQIVLEMKKEVEAFKSRGAI